MLRSATIFGAVQNSAEALWGRRIRVNTTALQAVNSGSIHGSSTKKLLWQGSLNVVHFRKVVNAVKVRRVHAEQLIGVSPSGKARDFDSRIRRFEPCHPSQISGCGAAVARLIWDQEVVGSIPTIPTFCVERNNCVQSNQ